MEIQETKHPPAEEDYVPLICGKYRGVACVTPEGELWVLVDDNLRFILKATPVRIVRDEEEVILYPRIEAQP